MTSKARLGGWALVAAIAAGGCGDEAPSFDYPLDATLRVNDLQAEGTHNSYHIAPDELPTPEWNYTHLPLDEQLGMQGVRQFEIDLHLNPTEDRFEVYHFFRADEQTTCRLFTDCLRAMKRWSDKHRAHHPIVVMLEVKDGFSEDYVEHYFDLFEQELSSVWPEDRLITPDLIRGEASSLAEALAQRGWPTLGEVRGRALFFFIGPEGFRSYYTHGGTSLEGRLAFVAAGVGAPYAAINSLDNPIQASSEIADSVAANMLIRTRVDVVGDEGPEIDPDRLDAALRSGAHFLSTDHPEENVAGGTPSRCNPVTAPPECTDTAIEDPAFVR